MSESSETPPRAPLWLATIIIVIVVVALSFVPIGGQSARHRFFATLRIAKPKPVTAGAAGGNPNRTLPVMIGAMLADSVTVAGDDPDQSAADIAAASKLAGFSAPMPAAREDKPTITVIGAREVRVSMKRDQLQTTLTQAGLGRGQVPAAFDGVAVSFTTPRAIKEQFGKCPEPLANTIAAQLQGPPPPSTDFGNCIVLVVTPATTGSYPAGLDVEQLVDVALELSGMSPQQAQSFQARFDWHAAMSLTLPRGMRSYDTLDVSGVRGMLLNTGGRRGPTYALIWAKDNKVFALTGYGSSADALPLAKSFR